MFTVVVMKLTIGVDEDPLVWLGFDSKVHCDYLLFVSVKSGRVILVFVFKFELVIELSNSGFFMSNFISNAPLKYFLLQLGQSNTKSPFSFYFLIFPYLPPFMEIVLVNHRFAVLTRLFIV